MTEEKSCNNCGIDLICQECDMGYSNWQPITQEKPMENKVIFESEEECYNFCGKVKLGMNHEAILWHVNEIKKHGYIRQSAVEEAEEMYQEWLYAMEATSSPINKDNLNIKLYEAIQELKSEIARLKK